MRPRVRPKPETPGEEEILAFENVPVNVAATFIGWSSATLYRALQEGRAPFGFGVECTGRWVYNISPGLLVKYKSGDLPTYRLREVEELACDGIMRLMESKMELARQAVGQCLAI